MNFNFTEEQHMLRENLQAWLHKHYSFEPRRGVDRVQQGWRADTWQALANELGILGAALPEKIGGLGGSIVDQMIIMETLGGSLIVEPYLETIVVSAALLEAAGGNVAESLLRSIVSGQSIAVAAWSEPKGRFAFEAVETVAERQSDGWRITGHKAVVSAAPWADHFLVSARSAGGSRDKDGISLFLMDRRQSGVTLKPYPTLDGRYAADIYFDAVAVDETALLGSEGTALPLLEIAGDRAIAGICAEGVGIIRHMLDATVEFTKQRKQFGQPIASFQVLQHRMVDMLLQAEMATSAMHLVNLKQAADPIERAMAASSAKVTVSKALRFVGQNAIQLHGGTGMTDELPISHYFKRATTLEHEYGSVDFHLARFDRLSRLSSAAA